MASLASTSPRSMLQMATPRSISTFDSARDRQALKAGAAASLLAPLPNLFRSTFEQASRTAKGEHWLRQRMEEFDAGGKQVRKRILEEFLEYIRESAPCSLEELFSNQVHLFFVRLTAWFSVTLPMVYELPLQLKVFLTFLQFREQAFVRAFFESGAFVPLMRALSADFDVPDEVRCLALAALHQLATHGREHKELMCSQGLVANVLECAVDGLQWETLKYSGRLLCELLHSNPSYQGMVLDALQDFLVQSLPTTQRVGAQAFISMLVSRAHTLPAPLCDPNRHRELVRRALGMLQSHDLRVGADAYCLLCHMVRMFGCDELLFEFARAQLRAEKTRANEWMFMEVRAKKFEENADEDEDQGPRNKAMLTRIQQKVAEALESQRQALEDEDLDAAELIKRLRHCSEEFLAAFKAEAGHILEWGLMMYIAKRNPGLCTELVEGGLTEMLLQCLLDTSHPVRQAAALVELHHLRALVPKAQKIAEAVLVRRELLQAMTFEQFARAADRRVLSQARYRLRNFHNSGKLRRDLGQESSMRTRMLDQDAQKARAGGGAFLTEAATRDKLEDEVPPGVAPDKDESQELEVKHLASHVPFCGSLASFLTDPLDLTADETSPLIQELKSIETNVGAGFRFRTLLGDDAPKQGMSARRAAMVVNKPSHREISQNHNRAMALCTSIDKRPTVRMPIRDLGGLLPDRSQSRMTDISVHMSQNEFLGVGPGRVHTYDCGCKVCAPLPNYLDFGAKAFFDSLQETTAGPDMLEDWSQELSAGPSHMLSNGPSLQALGAGHMQSSELSLQLPMEPSREGEPMLDLVCIPCESPSQMVPEQFDLLKELGIQEADEGGVKSEITQRSRIAAVEEIIRQGETVSSPSSKKKVLHMARPPYHDCIAFDVESIEKERAQAGRSVPQDFNLSTRHRFQALQKAGGFPRRWLQGGGAAQQAPRGNQGCQTPSTRSSSARGGSQSRGLATSELGGPPPSWRVLGEGSLPPLARVSKHAPRDMVDFFPASARREPVSARI